MWGAMIASSLEIAEQYLVLKNTKESRKYLDELIYLKKELNSEQNKSDDDINHTRIDNINDQLRILFESISSLGKQNAVS